MALFRPFAAECDFETGSNIPDLLESLSRLDSPAIVAREGGLVKGANQAALEVFGRGIVGRPLSELVRTQEEIRAGMAFRCLAAGVEHDVIAVGVSAGENADEGAAPDGICLVFNRASGITHDMEEPRALAVFAAFSRILERNSDAHGLLSELVIVLPALLGADAAWVHLCGPDGSLVLNVHHGCAPACALELDTLLPGQCLIGKVFTSGRPQIVREASSDARVTHISTGGSGLRSMACVPITSRGNALGVLSVASAAADYFRPVDMRALAVIGSQLGVALENDALISELRSRMEHINLISELSESINSSLSIGTIFRIIVSEIKKLINFDRASLLLYDEIEDSLFIYALETDMKTVLPKGMRAPIDGTSAGWVLRNEKPAINADLAGRCEFELDRRLLEDGIRSTVSLPLRQDRMLGVFNLDSARAGAYSEADLEVLLPVSRHIAIALENALLFEEVSREKKEWARTFDAITDMVWIEGIGGNVIRANKALLDRAGLPAKDISGMHCEELLDRLGISTGCLCAGGLRPDAAGSYSELKGPQGEVFRFWTYPLLDDENRPFASVHYLKDVTSEKRIEQQLIRNDRLASLGILGAGIAHEINNPMGIIAGYAEALLDRSTDPALLALTRFADFPEYLRTIHGEIFRCKEILGSLLEFSRPYRGKPRELDLFDIIKEVMLLVKHRARKLNHRLVLDLDRGLPTIKADAGHLRQLFVNIVMNAMYFTDEGGTISIRTGLDRDTGMVFAEVTDTGRGMPPGMMEKIFNPFYTTKPPGEGTGLGLSICHRIAEDHGGSIEVMSTPGKGTTFVIKLPAGGGDE